MDQPLCFCLVAGFSENKEISKDHWKSFAALLKCKLSASH